MINRKDIVIMTELFYKKTNPIELNILLQMKSWKEKNLFLSIVIFQPETNEIGIKKLSYDVHKARTMKKWTKESETKCILKICQVIDVLRKHGVLHQDVHLKNIVTNKSLTKFYLIDYDVSIRKAFSQMNLYEKQAFLYREDQFQLFWNFIFGHNEFPNDFITFRKTIRRLSKKKRDTLKHKLKLFFMKDYLEKLWTLFLSNEPVQFKIKQEQIIFKFFMTRLFLVHHIYLKEPNPYYQNIITMVSW